MILTSETGPGQMHWLMIAFPTRDQDQAFASTLAELGMPRAIPVFACDDLFDTVQFPTYIDQKGTYDEGKAGGGSVGWQ